MHAVKQIQWRSNDSIWKTQLLLNVFLSLNSHSDIMGEWWWVSRKAKKKVLQEAAKNNLQYLLCDWQPLFVGAPGTQVKRVVLQVCASSCSTFSQIKPQERWRRARGSARCCPCSKSTQESHHMSTSRCATTVTPHRTSEDGLQVLLVREFKDYEMSIKLFYHHNCKLCRTWMIINVYSSKLLSHCWITVQMKAS